MSIREIYMNMRAVFRESSRSRELLQECLKALNFLIEDIDITTDSPFFLDGIRQSRRHAGRLVSVLDEVEKLAMEIRKIMIENEQR